MVTTKTTASPFSQFPEVHSAVERQSGTDTTHLVIQALQEICEWLGENGNMLA